MNNLSVNLMLLSSKTVMIYMPVINDDTSIIFILRSRIVSLAQLGDVAVIEVEVFK